MSSTIRLTRDQLGAAHELLLRTPQGQPNRWVVQYNFYINDRQWARMFVRICRYLPFSARVCLNQHHWLANRMREGGIAFKQCANAFIAGRC